MLEKVISIRITEEQHARLKEIGEQEDRSLQQMVRMAIKEFIGKRTVVEMGEKSNG